ncbi:M16 family metallopeptidase [Streptomyces sp. NPDC059982]|uniref:M16 family metallopeptidase n=1 Tax=unclassified Streptomyces TaxID=2593676 RepID=UPI0036BD89B2
MTQAPATSEPVVEAYGNGARTVAVRRPGSGLVCVMLAVAAGSATDPPDLPGCAHFAEHAFFAGGGRFPSAAVVADVIGGLGGVFDAVTHRDYSLFHVKAPASTAGALLELMGELRTHRVPGEAEMCRQHTAMRHEIQAASQQPQRVLRDLADLALYGDTPVGRSPLGDAASLDRLTADHAAGFLRRASGPERSALLVVGDIDPATVQPAAERWLGHEPPNTESPWRRADGAVRAPTGLWRATPGPTVTGCWAVPASGYLLSHRDMQCMRLFNTVLGGSASSCISRALRDELGLTYRTRSVLEPLADVGSLLVLFTGEPDGVAAIVATIRRTIAELLQDGPTGQEVGRARALVKGVYPREREDSTQHARILALELFRRNRFTSQDAEAELLDSLTSQDIIQVAHQVLSPEAGRCVAVGPLPQAGPPLLDHAWNQPADANATSEALAGRASMPA